MATDLAVLQNGLAEELAHIAEAAARERISPDVLFNAVQRVLKQAHIEAALAGRQAAQPGGLQGALSRIMDWLAPLRGGLEQKLAGELSYMGNFISEIASGSLSEAQIAARFDQYAQHLQSTFYGAQGDTLAGMGMTEERRVLNPAEHCDDCLGLAAQGWQPIGTLPEPGEASACKANCLCEMGYR